MIMKPTGHNKWGKRMNVNKDKEIIRQPNGHKISELKIKWDSRLENTNKSILGEKKWFWYSTPAQKEKPRKW